MDKTRKKRYLELLIVIIIAAVTLLSFVTYGIFSSQNEKVNYIGSYTAREVSGEPETNTLFLPEGDTYQVDTRLFWLILSVAFSSTFIAAFLAYNITKRVETENELRESSERYMKAFGISPEAMIVHSNGIIVMANKAASQIVGLDNPKELEGKDLTGFANIRVIKELDAEKKDGEADKEYLPVYECEVKRKDGRVVRVLSTSVSFPFKGEDMELTVLKDMTTSDMLREKNEMDKLKSRFFANLSHELRTPLNVIMSTVQLLKMYSKKLPEKINPEFVLSKLEAVDTNCYRMLKQVRNLIDITKLDTGNYELNLQNADIVSVVKNIIISMSDFAGAHDIKLIFHSEMKEKIISCDRDAIERIILNLLSNAIKFSGKDCIVCVSIYSQGNNVAISVKDNGIGIPEHLRESIFEKFFHADDFFTRRAEGSGIGLSLVKSLVEMHGGSITLKSKEGQGSEFIVLLPAVITEHADKFDKAYSETPKDLDKVRIELSDILQANKK